MDCPECGAFNSMLAKECSECGLDLLAPRDSMDAEPEAALLAAVAPPSAANPYRAPAETATDPPDPSRVVWARRALLLGLAPVVLALVSVGFAFGVDSSLVREQLVANTVSLAILAASWLGAYLWSRENALAGFLAGIALALSALCVRLFGLAKYLAKYPWSMFESLGVPVSLSAVLTPMLVPLALSLLVSFALLRGIKHASELGGEGAADASPAWPEIKLATAAFAWLLGSYALLQEWSPSSKLLWWLGEVVTIVPFILLLVRRPADLRAAFAKPRGSLRALGLWLLSLLGCYAVTTAGENGLALAGLEVSDWTEPWIDAGWSAPALIALSVVWTPISEEVVFRGYLQQRLQALLPSKQALVLQATFFAIAHQSTAYLPIHFGVGLLLGMLRLVTGSLYASMAAYALWNLWLALSELYLR